MAMHELVDVSMAFLERCDQHTILTLLIKDFADTLRRFGFNYFMMTRLPALGEDAEPYIIAHTWPVAWLEQYRAQSYFWHDPVSLYSLTQARPFSWQEARRGSQRTRTASQLASEAKGIGLVDGIGFPLQDPSSAQAVVSLAADRQVELNPLSRVMLHQVCLNAEMRAAEIFDRTNIRVRPLSEREREVLRWIANGKNVEDVADILSLSERTIRDHLAHSRQKLNATTTTHAVARAIKSKQIIL